MEETFQAAIRSERVPGVALLARDITGKVSFSRCYGSTTVAGEVGSRPPMQLNTVLRIASASKLITSVMAVQCVQNGVVTLDEDLARLVPELAQIHVLTGFDSAGKPETRKPTTPVTLRHLLTHSSGMLYDVESPLLHQYRKYQGQPIWPELDKLEDRFGCPLMYDPGHGWSYGPSTDWAGRVVERASGQDLEHYMQAHICEPLGLKNTTFKLQQRPDMIAKMADVCGRDEDGKLSVKDPIWCHKDPDDSFGGMGIWTTPEDYIEVLWSLLRNDGKLLDSESLSQLFGDGLTTETRGALNKVFEEKKHLSMGGLLPVDVAKTYALGGLLTLEDCEDGQWRKKGNLSWSGALNAFWSIDREAGMCSMCFFHLQPWADETCISLGRVFDKAMYAMLNA